MAEEPVEIDINLRQNVDTEANKASDAIARLAAESSRAQENASRMINLQRDVVSRLKNEIETLQKAFSNVSIDTNDEKAIKWRQETYQQIRALNIELTSQEKILADLETRNNTLSESKGKLLSDIEAVATGMKNLALMGKGESEQYKELEAQLGAMADAYTGMKDEQDKIINARVDLESFSASLDGVSNSIREGVEQFGSASEKTGELTESLESVGRAQGVIEAGQKRVNETVEETAEKSKKASSETQQWSTANVWLAKTLGISNAAAQKLMVAMSLGLSLAISAVTVLIKKQVDKWREAKREQEEFNKSVATNAASQIANYEKLRSSYNKLGDDIKAKEKFILDNKSAFNQLGTAINDVNDADNLFISQTEAFTNSVMLRARASASMELATEKYQKALQKQQEIDSMRDIAPSSYTVGGGVMSGTTIYNPGNAGKKARMQKEADKLFTEADNYIKKQVDYEAKATEELEKANIDNAKKLTEGTKAWWEAKKQNAQARLDAMTDAQKNSEDWNAVAQEIRDADKIIKSFDITGSDKKDANAEKKASAAAEKLEKWGVDIQNDIDAAVVAAMEEGREKKLEELKADYDKRIALIEQRRHEIELLEKETGVDGSHQKNQLTSLESSETAKFEKQTRTVIEASKKVMAEVWNEIDSRFRTENENRLVEIDLFYAEQAKKAKENGATQEELDNITLSHKRDIELEKHQIALESLDFETQIELRRAQILDRRVLLESDREERILKIQLEAAKKRLSKLREIESAGGDSAKDIEAVTVEIEALNAELNKIPERKIAEVMGMISDALGGIGDFASVFDADLGNFANMLSGAIDGIANIATGNSKQIIDGSIKLLQTAGKLITANKQANEEIRKFNISLAQQAIDYSLAVIRSLKDIKSETDNIFTSNYTNTLSQGMAGYNAAIDKQAELMRQLGAETVKTGVKKKKFLGITTGTRDIYSSLLKTYPDLIKKDGTLNRELAESLQKSGNLKKETSQLIDNILQASDAANEAMQAVESELQSLVGSIGDELKKVLDDAFASGTDSAKAMTDNVVSMLKDISTQKLFNAVFGSLFTDLEQRMKDSYGVGGDMDITDDLDWFMRNYPGLVDSYNKGLSELQKAIQDRYGVDVFEAENTRKAASKAISGVSQDSFDDFSGRLTFLVMKVSGLGTINASILDTDREQLAVMYAMLGHMEEITENSRFLIRLKEIDENIGRMMREGINIKR